MDSTKLDSKNRSFINNQYFSLVLNDFLFARKSNSTDTVSICLTFAVVILFLLCCLPLKSGKDGGGRGGWRGGGAPHIEFSNNVHPVQLYRHFEIKRNKLNNANQC